ncbi:hypothetical protein ACLOJK_018364 [Asimina triloba]
MGTHMKQTIFDDQTSKALKKWTKAAKKKQKTPPHSPRTFGANTGFADTASPVNQYPQINTDAKSVTTSQKSQPSIELSAVEDDGTRTPLTNSLTVPNLL